MKFLLSLSLLTLFAVSVEAEEWNRFRGPNGTGVSDVKKLPTTFDEANTLWKVPMGRGWSSPVLWGDKIFLTAEKGATQRVIECLSAADGKTLWTYDVPYAPYKQHKFNSFASSSPYVDADRVYVNWTSGDAVEALALDHQGKLLWRRENLAAYIPEHGSGCSAVVADSIMIVRSEFDGPDNRVLGLDIATGETKWTLKIETTKNPYSTPVVREGVKGKEFIIVNSSSGVLGIDAKTGVINWQHNPGYTQRSVGSFALKDDLFFATFGSGGGGKESAMLKLDGNKPSEAYRLVMGIPYVPTPLVVGDLMYLLGDGGILKCVKFQTGEEVFTERLSGEAGNSTKYFSSPVSAMERSIAARKQGDVLVVKAGDKFEVLGAKRLLNLDGKAEPINATPALANGRVYIRSESVLWCLGDKLQPVP